MRLNLRRLSAWLILAPVGAAFGAAFALGLLHWLTGWGDARGYEAWEFNPNPAPLLGVTLLYGLVAAMLAVAANATIGVIWQIAAHRLRWRGLPTHLAAGITSGIVFAAIILWDVLVTNWRAGQAIEVVPLVCFGALVGGLTAWFAWLIRRPDRDAPNPATPSA